MRLGIDLGTTRTLVAGADRGNYPIVTFENGEGDFQEWFPSLIAIHGDERRYGFDALEVAHDPEWTIRRSFKRLLGATSPNGMIFGIPVLTLLTEFLASLKVALGTRSNIELDEPLEVAVGVPANSNSNQRFLTMEGFRLAGFHVIGMVEEPCAAGVEYANRYRDTDLTRKRENLLVYDLGGGTFDCSVIRMTGLNHSVIATSGIGGLGGDDFDHLLLQMVQPDVSDDTDSLLEICRVAKEKLTPNSRRVLLSLNDSEFAINLDDFYKQCGGLIEQTVGVVESVIEKAGGEETISCIYIVGGGSEFPPVGRALKARFGRRVRKSSYAHAATAIGLAIAADERSEITLDHTFTRNFGVWRELEYGSGAAFDVLFPKGSPIPSQVVRRYHPVHNIGHFRYLECDSIDDSNCPIGDVAPWDDIRFPFEPGITAEPAITEVHPSKDAGSQLVEEAYDCDENGIIQVTIRNLTGGYEQVFSLHR